MKTTTRIIIFLLIQSLLLVECIGISNRGYIDTQYKNYTDADKLSPKLLIDKDIKQAFDLINTSQKGPALKEKTEEERVRDLFHRILNTARSEYGLQDEIRLEIGTKSLLDKLLSTIARGRTYKSKKGYVVVIYEMALSNYDNLVKTIGHEIAHIVKNDIRLFTPFVRVAQISVGLAILAEIANKYFRGFIYDTFSFNFQPDVWAYSAAIITGVLMVYKLFIMEPATDKFGDSLAKEAGLLSSQQKNSKNSEPDFLNKVRKFLFISNTDKRQETLARDGSPEPPSKRPSTPINFTGEDSLSIFQELSQNSFLMLQQAI